MDVLIVFVQNPSSRLHPQSPLHQRRQAEFERQQQLVHKACCDINARRVVYYSDHVEPRDVWNGCEKRLQIGIHTGEKMYHAISREFNHGANRVVLVKSDNAFLTEELILSAFENLASRDIVIGPREDGSYYLLGMNGLHYTVFEPNVWNGNAVLRKTRERLDLLRLNYCTIKAVPAIRVPDLGKRLTSANLH